MGRSLERHKVMIAPVTWTNPGPMWSLLVSDPAQMGLFCKSCMCLCSVCLGQAHNSSPSCHQLFKTKYKWLLHVCSALTSPLGGFFPLWFLYSPLGWPSCHPKLLYCTCSPTFRVVLAYIWWQEKLNQQSWVGCTPGNKMCCVPPCPESLVKAAATEYWENPKVLNRRDNNIKEKS